MRIAIVERLTAWRRGSWWKQCPLCDRWFGGHEAGWTTQSRHGFRWFKCPDCSARALSASSQSGEERA